MQHPGIENDILEPKSSLRHHLKLPTLLNHSTTCRQLLFNPNNMLLGKFFMLWGRYELVILLPNKPCK